MENLVHNATKAAQHPFYPIEANIVGYLANKWSVLTLLTSFAGGWAVILGSTWALVRRHNPNLPGRDKATILWFVLSKWKAILHEEASALMGGTTSWYHPFVL